MTTPLNDLLAPTKQSKYRLDLSLHPQECDCENPAHYADWEVPRLLKHISRLIWVLKKKLLGQEGSMRKAKAQLLTRTESKK